MSWCGPLRVHLVWESLCSWTDASFIFTQIGKFSVIILQIGSWSLALSLPLLVSLRCGCHYASSCCPHVPLNYLHSFQFFFFFFFFAAVFGCLFLPLLPNRWFDPLLHITSFYSFQCILDVIRYGILHFRLVLFHGFYALFHTVIVLANFLEQPYNHYFYIYSW